MALRLTDLQSRVNGKRRRNGAGAQAPRHPMPAAPANTPAPAALARRRGAAMTMRKGRAMSGDLGSEIAQKMIARGVPADQAQALIEQINAAQTAESQSLGRALSAPQVTMPTATEASEIAAGAFINALSLTPMGLWINGLFLLCDELDVAISIGVGYLVGFGAGGGSAVGIVFAPGRRVGYFSSFGTVMGWVASASASVTVSIVRGGLAAFNGRSVTLGVTAGVENPAEPISPGGGFHEIFSTSGEFIGITGEISLSAGLSPIEVFRGEWETRSRTVQARSLHRAGLAAPAYLGRAQTATTLQLDTRYRAFIPSPAIMVELPGIGTDLRAFSGDGRSFSHGSGTSRAQIDARVQLRGGGVNARVVSSTARWGESKRYPMEDVLEVPGKPSWWRDTVENPRVLERATLPRTPDNLGVEAGGFGTQDAVYGVISDDSMFTYHVDGGLPLLPSVTPNINARLRLLLRANGGQVEARLHGNHDGFPAHEFYVEGVRIYGYDPVAAGNSPLALNGLGDGDIAVDTNWVSIGPRANFMRAA